MTATLDNPAASDEAQPMLVSRRGADHQQAKNDSPTDVRAPAGLNLPDGKVVDVANAGAAVGDQTSRATTDAPNTARSIAATSPGSDFTTDKAGADTNGSVVGGDQIPRSNARLDANPRHAAGPILADPLLGVLADVVDDLESVRIANENRLRTLTDTSEHGHGLTLQQPEVARLAAQVRAMRDAEHQAVLNLGRSMRKHPLWVWAKPIHGVGEKQFARLLAVLGDPYWNDLHDRPRRITELRAYCGFHVVHPGGKHTGDANIGRAAGVAPKRQRGHKSNWNEDARKRAWLIATSCLKQADSPYRAVYDAAREQYTDSLHPAACVRCGPAGKPALEGSPLSPGHQHARAIRKVAVAFLSDLWAEARRLHESEPA